MPARPASPSNWDSARPRRGGGSAGRPVRVLPDHRTQGSPDPGVHSGLRCRPRPGREDDMKRILILGAGTAGTVMANRLARVYRRDIAARRTAITVVDRDDQHVYQPGLLFVPFGIYRPEEIVRPRSRQLAEGVTYVSAGIDRV